MQKIKKEYLNRIKEKKFLTLLASKISAQEFLNQNKDYEKNRQRKHALPEILFIKYLEKIDYKCSYEFDIVSTGFDDFTNLPTFFIPLEYFLRREKLIESLTQLEIKDILEIYCDDILNFYHSLSERQKRYFFKNMRNVINFLESYYYARNLNSDEINEDCYKQIKNVFES